jgi:hypothetical protein
MAAVAVLVLAAGVAPASALEAQLPRLAVAGARVVATLELRDLLRDQFLEVVQQGRAIFLQVQADFWEDRRLGDRLALTTPQLTYRIDRGGERGVIVTDQFGTRTEHQDITRPLEIRIDLGPASSLVDDRSYYAQVNVTAATVPERTLEQAGAAMLDDPQSAEGLAGLGRLVFRTLLRIGQYLDTTAAEATSRTLSGLAIRSAS